MHPLRRHLLADIFPQWPIDGLVRLGRGLERKRHLLHLGDRHDQADGAAHQGIKLDLARQQHLEGVRIAAGDLVVLGIDSRFDAAVGVRFDGVPHRVTAGHAEAAGDHLGEPFRLAFDDLEEARARLEHADERESSRVRREDAPIQRKLPALAPTKSVRKERKADPIPRRKDDCVGVLLAAIAEQDPVAGERRHVGAALERSRSDGGIGHGRHHRRPARLEQAVPWGRKVAPIRSGATEAHHGARHQPGDGQGNEERRRGVEVVERSAEHPTRKEVVNLAAGQRRPFGHCGELGDDVERRLGAADHNDPFAHEGMRSSIVPGVHDRARELAG